MIANIKINVDLSGRLRNGNVSLVFVRMSSVVCMILYQLSVVL